MTGSLCFLIFSVFSGFLGSCSTSMKQDSKSHNRREEHTPPSNILENNWKLCLLRRGGMIPSWVVHAWFIDLFVSIIKIRPARRYRSSRIEQFYLLFVSAIHTTPAAAAATKQQQVAYLRARSVYAYGDTPLTHNN